jgi:hypothetical protein
VESAPASAILKPTLKDRASFVASRRTIRVRPATVEEMAEAGLTGSTPTKVILLRLCHSMVKVIITERPLAGDVTEAANTFATLCGRPQEEALAAATYLGMMTADDLAELGHRMMADRAGCAQCTCASGYAPLAVTLAEAAARAALSPWLLSGLSEHTNRIKAAAPCPILATSPSIKSAADAVSKIVEAAGYPEPLNRS